jgi:hypothetical protein
MAIVPVAKALYVCDAVGTEGGKTELYGLFNSIRASRLPHVVREFAVFAQLAQGLGDIPFYVDLRRATDGLLVHTSLIQTLRFRTREQTLQAAMTFRGIELPTAGVYLLELVCDNVWVADVALRVREVST